MRKILWALMFVLAMNVGGVISAQEAPSKPLYIVQPGDTLYEIARRYFDDPQKFEQIIDANPFLNTRGRIFRKNADWVVVIIKPGEQLAGLEQLGITAKLIEPADLSELAVISITAPPPMDSPATSFSLSPASLANENVVTGDAESARAKEVGANGQQNNASYRVIYEPFFWILVLAAMLIIAGYLLLCRYHWRFQDPTTSGEAIVHGGVNSTQPNAIERRFQQIAQRQLGEMNPIVDLATEIPVRIGPIEEGTLSGNGRVRYRNTWERRHMHREPAFRARFRFPDGRKEDLFFLQRCGNDVYFGTRYDGYRFEPGRVIVETPTPPATIAQTATSALPKAATSTTAQETSQIQSPVVTITIGTITLMIPSGSLIGMDPNGAITVSVTQPGTINVLPAVAASSNSARPTAASATT